VLGIFSVSQWVDVSFVSVTTSNLPRLSALSIPIRHDLAIGIIAKRVVNEPATFACVYGATAYWIVLRVPNHLGDSIVDGGDDNKQEKDSQRQVIIGGLLDVLMRCLALPNAVVVLFTCSSP
jgi:hypothetical protein